MESYTQEPQYAEQHMTIDQVQNVHVKALHHRGPFAVRRLEVSDGLMVVCLDAGPDLLERLVVSGLKMGAPPLTGVAALSVDGHMQRVSAVQNKRGNIVFEFEGGARLDTDVYLAIGGDRGCTVVVTMR